MWRGVPQVYDEPAPRPVYRQFPAVGGVNGATFPAVGVTVVAPAPWFVTVKE
jgi:hypothetical protein